MEEHPGPKNSTFQKSPKQTKSEQSSYKKEVNNLLQNRSIGDI